MLTASPAPTMRPNDITDARAHSIGAASPSAAHAATMRALSARLDGIGSLVPPGSEIAYLDFPLYFNVGDQLINLGAEALFARMGYRVSVRMSMFDLCTVDWDSPHRTTLREAARQRLSALDPEAVLVFQGGGNFGDLYPEFQVMRELVVAAFADRRIVILPQSLHFSSPSAERQSLERLLAHPDLHICVRDPESLALLQRHRPGAGLLLPDMAHALWNTPGWESPPPVAAHTLILRRRDGEAAGLGFDDAAATQLDWPDIVRSSDMLAFRLIRKAMASGLDGGYRLPVAAWYRLRDRLVKRSVRLFARHDQVVTDRLHGMILAALLGRPLRYADNSYGKLSRYAGAWLASSPMVRRLGSEPAARATRAEAEAVAS